MLANSGISIGQLSGSDATDRLRETLEAMNAATVQQTKTMTRLTWAMALMTAVMMIGLAVQIYLAWD